MLACLLACLSRACRGIRPLSGLVSAIRRAEVLRHAGQYRELSTPVGTAGNDPSQSIESATTGICTSPLAATQHRPRLLAPARQLVRRRDQRLLPRRVFNPDRARESSFGCRSPVIKNPLRRKLQARHPAIRLAYGTAGRQFVCSDHPGLSESAVGKVCRLKVANPVSGHPRGIRHRRTSVCLQ